MSVIAASQSINASPFSENDTSSVRQRDKLKHFATKFPEYLPAFDAPVVIQHLLFVKAIQKVFSSIDEPFYTTDQTGRKCATPATRVFLTKALIRFQAWIEKAICFRTSGGPLQPSELPPLDVLIILHGYQLSPWAYDEDVGLRFPQMGQIGRFPLEHIVNLINAETSEYNPSADQVSTWENLTGLPFDVSMMDETTSVVCPACSTIATVPWISGIVARDGGQGFAETGFLTTCSSCNLLINEDALATGKFLRDLIACQGAEERILAGTLIGGIGMMQLKTARTIASQVISTLGDPRDNLGHKLSWSMSTVANRLEADPESIIRKAKVTELLRPYEQSSPFSTDLVYKALLQADFASRSSEKGMLEISFLKQIENKVITDAIRAYRLFLKLVILPHMPKVYPTYGVDLVWHTHQLLGNDYKLQTFDMVGVFLDHRPMDEIAPTSAKFDAARDAWKAALVSAGLPAFEPSAKGPIPYRADSPTACSVSASNALYEDSILAIEILDDAERQVSDMTPRPSIMYPFVSKAMVTEFSDI